MNHQLYEEWLFTYYDPAEEELTSQQIAELEAHLQGCQDCRKLADGWRGAGAQLRKAQEVAPQPGFTDRWQARFMVERQRLHHRQTLAMLIFAIGGAALLFGSLVVISAPWLREPRLLFWSWVYQMITLFAYADVVREVAASLFRTTTGAIPLVGWVFLAGLLCELGVLWVVSFRLLTNPRRIMQ